MQVLVWAIPNNGRSLSDYESLASPISFEPYGTEQCSTVLWVSASVVVTGNADNSIIKLWHVTDTAQLLQSLTFTNTEASSDSSFFNHMDVQPDTQLLILANSRQNAVYTLHFTGSDDMLRFDYLADFSVSQAIMSFTVQYNPSDNPAALHLYCTQPTAIQNYTLNPALCRPPDQTGLVSTTAPADAPPGMSASQQRRRHGPMTYADLLIMSKQELAAGPSAYSSGSTTTPPDEPLGTVPSQQRPSRSTPMTYAHLLRISQKEATSAPATRTPPGQQIALPSSQPQPSSIRTTPQPASPAGPTEQPRLLTPTHLMQQAKRSASQSSMASLLSQHTPTSAARSVADNTDAVSTASTQGSKLQEGSVSRQQSAETIPSSAAALDASISSHPDSPSTSVSESRATTPPPTTPALPSAAYLTPEQYNPHHGLPEALPSTGSQHDLKLDLVSKPGSSDQVNVKLLRRDERSPAGAGAGSSQQPPAAPSAVFSQPLDLLPVPSAAQPLEAPIPEAAPAAHRDHGEEAPVGAAVDSSAGLLGPNVDLSGAAVKAIADAVAERTLAQHKQLLSYLNERHREMLRIIKADIREEGKRLQLVFDAQVRLCPATGLYDSTDLLLGALSLCELQHESHRTCKAQM